MQDKTFEQFEKELENGFQVYFTYVRNRYLVFKTSDNCYTQKLISKNDKNPQPKISMITRKRLHEIYPFMEEVEYKVRVMEE